MRSCSSGDNEYDTCGNASETTDMGDDTHENCVCPDPETSQGDAPGFRCTEDFIDKIFSTEEEAYAAYKQFAWLRGFGTRNEKHYDCPARVREEKLESQTGCLAKLKIYFDMQDQVWKVCRIDDDHNHPLAPTMFSHRNLSESDKAQVDSLKKFEIVTSKIMAYMAGQSGGYRMLRFTKRDLYNIKIYTMLFNIKFHLAVSIQIYRRIPSN
ncbi:uncharacterized protein LOC130965893 [Arachis stenosperma]|uniref:uncharacterized protein LOC130965893 n=1 Tax=Arachis stenosperma TaxID=217475 RepID=UPI0025ACB45F|nr:uncharacterized protein LOC130965893 [Arachis stenosperma]